METPVIIYLIATSVITSLVWYISLQKLKLANKILKSNQEELNKNLEKEVQLRAGSRVAELERIIVQLKSDVTEAKHQGFKEGHAKARSEFTIQVSPYRQEHLQGNEGWFVNDIYHQISLGYSYQLFLNGIPILQPSVVVHTVLEEEKRQVDLQRIAYTISKIHGELREIAESSNGMIKLLSSGSR